MTAVSSPGLATMPPFSVQEGSGAGWGGLVRLNDTQSDGGLPGGNVARMSLARIERAWYPLHAGLGKSSRGSKREHEDGISSVETFTRGPMWLLKYISHKDRSGVLFLDFLDTGLLPNLGVIVRPRVKVIIPTTHYSRQG